MRRRFGDPHSFFAILFVLFLVHFVTRFEIWRVCRERHRNRSDPLLCNIKRSSRSEWEQEFCIRVTTIRLATEAKYCLAGSAFHALKWRLLPERVFEADIQSDGWELRWRAF